MSVEDCGIRSAMTRGIDNNVVRFMIHIIVLSDYDDTRFALTDSRLTATIGASSGWPLLP